MKLTTRAVSSVYIHIPFCVSRCHYCIFPIHAQGKSGDSSHVSSIHKIYFDSLQEEIKYTLNQRQGGKKSVLNTLYFGGGTPSLFPIEYYEKIFEVLRNFYSIPKECEITLELDPGTFTEEKLKALASLGVNRLSLGVQTFDEGLLKALNRSHTLRETYQAIESIKKSGFENMDSVSLDFIMNLPGESELIWEKNLKEIERLMPGHLSIYSLILEPESNLVRKFRMAEYVKPLNTEEESVDRYKYTSNYLKGLGFDHYEISSYCRNDMFGKHNSVYWEGNSEYLAFGMGASSFIDRKRFTRPKNIKAYSRYVEELIKGALDSQTNSDLETSFLDIAKSVVMGKLRTSQGLGVKEFAQKVGITQEISKKIISEFVQSNRDLDDKLQFDGSCLKLTVPEGFLFNDEVTVRFFLHLERSGL